MEQQRIYPVGIQDFEKLRKKEAVYVDKTDLVYKLAQKDYVFLSRPRRFGKSLLSSTLKYYFQGRKDLFQGLAIEQLEKDWVQYPVLHFDLSTLKNQDLAGIKSELERQLSFYENEYGLNAENKTAGQRLATLICDLHKQTGNRTVVLIDEYDTPMLNILHDDARLNKTRTMMLEFYAPLKACDADLQFVFMTGVTKFSQYNIYDVLNNFTDITLSSNYATICGFTEKELNTTFKKDIKYIKGYEENKTLHTLSELYGGYCFSDELSKIFNPFGILTTFMQRELYPHWWEITETDISLINRLKHSYPNLIDLDGIQIHESDLEYPKESFPLFPTLYQNGYLTIQDYDKEWGEYTLGIPNVTMKNILEQNLK